MFPTAPTPTKFIISFHLLTFSFSLFSYIHTPTPQNNQNGLTKQTIRSFKMRAAEYPEIAPLPLCQRVCRISSDPAPMAGKPPSLQVKSLCSDYKDDGTNILLDANENAYGPGLLLNKDGSIEGTSTTANVNGSLSPQIDFLGLNRYPDP